MSNIPANIDAKQCIGIWRSVLNQAVTDALNGDNFNRRSAIRWAFGENQQDFYFVCNCAQVSPNKIKGFLINEFAIKAPDAIKNSLYEEVEIGRYPQITLSYKSIPKLDTSSPISFIYESMDMNAYVQGNDLWLSLNQLNHRWKFCDGQDVTIRNINTLVDPKRLMRKKANKVILFTDAKGLFQLSQSLKSSPMKLFAKWVERKNYKQYIINPQDKFKLKFQNYSILACLYKNKLFLRFKTISEIFFLATPTHQKDIHQKDKFFYAYLDSQKRQLMVRADLLIKLIESKVSKLERYIEIRPKIIQWIKEQQRLFEGKTNDK